MAASRQNIYNMKRNIVCLDTETTGTDKKIDKIIQLSCVKIDPDFVEIDNRNWYIIPSGDFNINPDAEAVHGISKEFLMQNGIPMKDIYEDFIEFIKDCDILTFNGNRFDIYMIYKDMSEFTNMDFLMKDRKFYDSMVLETKIFPRTLSALYKKYTLNDLDGAHDALTDVRGTIEVFRNQKNIIDTNAEFTDLLNDHDFSILSPEGSIYKKDNLIYIKFGKYKDREFIGVLNSDPNYIKWFLGTVSSYTSNVLKQYYMEYRAKLAKS